MCFSPPASSPPLVSLSPTPDGLQAVQPPSCLLSLLLLAFLACAPSEAQIKEEIQKAQVCTATSDCVDLGSKCPFGCSIPVNKTKADSIKQMIAAFPSSCAYDCLPVKEIQCKDQRCTTLFSNSP